MSEQDLNLSKAPLLSHLIELRKRLLYCMAFFALAFATSYYFSEYIYSFLLQPLITAFGEEGLENRRMIYTGLHEAFFTYLRLAFFSALFFSLPIVLNQIWKFIAPGLHQHEQRAFAPVLFMTPILFLMGAALAFYVVFPLAWNFFLSFETSALETGMNVELEARVGEYLSLVIRLILAFSLSFELPVLLFVLAKIGFLTADSLVSHRRHAIVAVFALAAFITPPDLISQIALGTPILILYEVSILLIRYTASDQEGRIRAAAQQ